MNRENKRKTFEKGYYKTHACHDIFTCKVCGRLCTPENAGSDHRNHCPNCLSSLHLDIEPGDRACRRVGKKAEHPQQAQLLRQGSFHGFPFQKTQYMTALRMRSALRLCAWQIYVFDLKIACADNAFASAFGAEERKIP